MVSTTTLRTKLGPVLLVLAIVLAIGGQSVAAQTPASGEGGLVAVKQYVVDQTTVQKTATEQLLRFAGRYAVLAEGAGYDYQAMWDANTPETAGLMAAIKAEWVNAHNAYEMNEGLIAGIPSLASFDRLIDSGPSAAEDPAGALDWTLTLSDGSTVVKPGNLFHHLTEPMLWGTVDSFVALRVDLNADGAVDASEALPEARLFLAAAQALDDATAEMQTAINDWEPTIGETFTALVTMLPTIGEYFEQWKRSQFVAGDSSTETGFVASSRLVDLSAFAGGLRFIYSQIGPAVAAIDPALDTQIQTGFTELLTFVTDLHQQEIDGKAFTPEEAEVAGKDAQAKATVLTGRISQAMVVLGLKS